MSKWIISDGCTVDEDSEQKCIIKNGEAIHLRPQCWALLIGLIKAKSKNRKLSFDNIGEIIWGDDGGWMNGENGRKEALTEILKDLRKSIGKDLDLIGNTYGNGYYLKHSVKEIETSALNRYSERKTFIYKMLFPGRPQLIKDDEPCSSPTENYIERAFILEQLERPSQQKVVVIYGIPGSGKSTFLLHYIKNQNVAAFFSCRWDEADRSDILLLLKSICVQLLELSMEYCKNLYFLLENMESYELLSESVSRLFELLILLPLENVHFDEVHYIVIDGIDELADPSSFVKALNRASRRLPAGIRVILSSRESVISNYNLNDVLKINLNKEKNNESIRIYLENRLQHTDLSGVIDVLLEKCNGSFLYAKCLCDYYDKHAINDNSNGVVPEDLNAIYYDYFERLFIDRHEYSQKYSRIFSIILASKHALTIKELRNITGWDEASTVAFINKVMDLLDTNAYPEKITFFHKSIGDWLQSISAAKEFYVSKQQGTDLIFDYIRNCYMTGEYEAIPYHILKEWKTYGARNTQKSRYKEMLNDIDFLLFTIQEYRNHSDFSPAVEEIKLLMELGKSTDGIRLRAQMAMNDIMIDLEDKRAYGEIDSLLKEEQRIFEIDPFLAIHLFENAGWINMQSGDLEKSEKYYKRALAYYDDLAYGSRKRKSYAHTLYLYSITLYRMRKIKDCKDNLHISQDIIRAEEDERYSLSYSLGLKMLAWVEVETNNRNNAEKMFLDALTIQKNLYDEPNLYIAHTLTCLAENEYHLYFDTKEKKYADLSFGHIAEAKEIYIKFDIRCENNIIRLTDIEEKLKNE